MKTKFLLLITLALIPSKIYADGEYLGKSNEVVPITLGVLAVPFISGLTPHLYKKNESYSYWASTGYGFLGLIVGMGIGSPLGTSTETESMTFSDGSTAQIEKKTSTIYPSMVLGVIGMLGGNYLGYYLSRKEILNNTSILLSPSNDGLNLTLNTTF